jgi:phosphoribosylformylglycinamidine cyclo-ligase
MRYRDAGVDIDAGGEAVKRIKRDVRTTFGRNVLSDLGLFGGFYAFEKSGWRKPVLVSSIDGVGTKLKVAFMANRYESVGEDLVNHCVNDILVGGARPLFFLDYIACGKLDPRCVQQLVSGMARGCRTSGCALIGGETAEMPGFYQIGDYDVAGCIVGAVEKSRILVGKGIRKGDALIGLPSSGLHTNGYSLARKVLFELADYDVEDAIPELGTTLGDALLAVHRNYFPLVHPLLDRFDIRGMSHVTGGGLVGNTVRVLPKGRSLKIDWDAWTVPPVFRLIQRLGDVPEDDMRRTFNMGVGYVLIVAPKEADALLAVLRRKKEKAAVIGEVA